MPEKELSRFGVSMPEDLMVRFDRYVEERGYSNRSEALRDLIRKALLEPERLEEDQTVAGTIVLVYDHHAGDLPGVLTELQHGYHRDIVSTMHVHLNRKQCLEIVVVRGLLSRLRELHRQIRTRKGVAYAELSVTYIDEGPQGHDHGHTHEQA